MLNRENLNRAFGQGRKAFTKFIERNKPIMARSLGILTLALLPPIVSACGAGEPPQTGSTGPGEPVPAPISGSATKQPKSLIGPVENTNRVARTTNNKHTTTTTRDSN